jgi:hypothetical protein
MEKAIVLEELKPSEIVDVCMDEHRILKVSFNYPILNADLDYKIACYLKKQKEKFEKEKGKCLGAYVDITKYHLLDSVSLFGITLPSPRVRKLHGDMHKDSPQFKRVAIRKKDTSRLAEVCVKMATIYHGKDVRLFSDPEKAVNWLVEGIKLLPKAEKER